MTQANKGAVQRHELEELSARLSYLDEERRKAARVVGTLEQKLAQQEQTIASREQRIKDLEARLAEANFALNRAAVFDATLDQFKDELVGLIEQYDKRHTRELQEVERLRRAEYESIQRDLANFRKEQPNLTRLLDELELRQAEDSRLASMIGKLQTRVSSVDNRIESWDREIGFVTANDQQRAKMITELEGEILEYKRKLETVQGRLDTVSHTILRAEQEAQTSNQSQIELQQMVKSWVDQVQLGEFERNQRVSKFNEVIDSYKETMAQYSREWSGFVEQNSAARLAVQTINDWQEQLEQQQREISELSRVEINRMQVRWDNFLADIEKRWRSFEVEQNQKLAEGLRRDKTIEEQLAELQESFKKEVAEQEALWRVQTAQLDAIKQLPRIWLEEVEKARARDPNRRREPSLVQVEEDVF